MSLILVYAEQGEGALRKPAIEAVSEGRRRADEMGLDLVVLMAGSDISSLASPAACYGADVVYLMEGAEFEPYHTETYTAAFSELILELKPELVLLGHTSKAGLVSDCVDIIHEGKVLTYVRPIYAGKAFARIRVNTATHVVTLRPNVFSAEQKKGRGEIRSWTGSVPEPRAKVERVDLVQAAGPELAEADIIVSGGRGLGDSKGFELLGELAHMLGAALGASRAVVDAGWMPQTRQVGQTGKVVSPDLYIACGISGAIQHIAGMGCSKLILAINKEPEANIFQVADLGIVADLYEAVPLLISRLKEFVKTKPAKKTALPAAEAPLEKEVHDVEDTSEQQAGPAAEKKEASKTAPPAAATPHVDADQVVRDMEAIVSSEYVSACLFEKVKSTIDIFPYEVEREKLPHVVVMPMNVEEVSAIMRYANQKGIPVYPRGSGTSFTGASRYQHPGIVLNTFRMQGFELFEDMFYFECEPGLVCNDLALKLEEKGYFLPFAPGSRLIATMGGLTCNNTSGHINDASIGKPADYIIGVEAVLPSGEIIRTGTKGVRRIAGTDLTKFFVGSDGLLGVITKIRMRLVPAFEKAYGIAVFDDLAALARGVQRMYLEKRPIPIFMEFMEHETAKIGYDIAKLGDPGGSVIFFVNMGRTREEAEAGLDLVLRSFEAENPIEVRAVSDMKEWSMLWGTREVIGSFLMQSTENQWVSLEVVSNLRDLPQCLEEAVHFNEGLPVLGELKNYIFGHIGSLTMHPGVIIPKEWDNERKRKAIHEKFQREMELNLKYGTCGGEWGQFAKRTEFFRRMYGEVGYQFIVKIKEAIDPRNILNRGVLEGY